MLWLQAPAPDVETNPGLGAGVCFVLLADALGSYSAKQAYLMIFDWKIKLGYKHTYQLLVRSIRQRVSTT